MEYQNHRISPLLYCKNDSFFVITFHYTVMFRLNSGNFGIFNPDGFYLNLDSSLESALKIIKNDTDIAYEL